MNEKVYVIDFGSQYTQLIARRIRELFVYCEIYPCTHVPEPDETVKAIVLSGSPYSVNDANALQIDLNKMIGRLPILGICYGAQLIANNYDGKVGSSEKREYGKAHLLPEGEAFDDPLFDLVQDGSQVWMSHGDSILELPDNYEVIAYTSSIPIAAFRSKPDYYEKPVYCIQFHPEVSHSLQGKQILHNFLRNIAGCHSNWTASSFIDDSIMQIKAQIGNDKVIMGLSGGVDSTVAACLLQKAIGDHLFGLFIDNGLLRKNEFEQVLSAYDKMGLQVIGIDGSSRFITALQGVVDPEKKRKIIGRKFIEIFEEEAHKLQGITWLGQGTIYPDVIESVSVHGPSATIKSHHNVGGLPEVLKLKIVEPLRMLFKDEVRKIGLELEIPPEILGRHPFPGPGLGIRILGEITEEKIELCQKADAIFIDHLKKYEIYDEVWQAGTILLPVQSVGVMGDERTYEYTLALRCVNSQDGMTAEWSKLSYDLLAAISSTIINQVKGINRVVYDISTKPPATIEWE